MAAEAGISKASVLYDYKTKRALIRTLIERRVAADEEPVQRFVDAQTDGQNARIRGHVAAATRSFSDGERSVGLNLCAALAQDEGLREPVQESLRATIAGIEASSTHPRGAMLAFLSIQGMMLLDWFGLHSFSAPERDRLIAEIGWLIQQSPAALNKRPGGTPPLMASMH